MLACFEAAGGRDKREREKGYISHEKKEAPFVCVVYTRGRGRAVVFCCAFWAVNSLRPRHTRYSTYIKRKSRELQ